MRDETLNSPIGVSPAFVFSKHTTAFSCGDFVESIETIAKLGFQSFQPEIFHKGRLSEWVDGGAREIAAAAGDHGLQPSQFVGHFLLENFASSTQLESTTDSEDLKHALEAATAFEGCRIFTVPQAPLQVTNGESHEHVWALLVGKIARYKETVEAGGFQMALEVLNGSLVGNTDGFLRLANDLGDDRLGVTLDTGHAWAARECIQLLPSKLGARLVGLHLKDNDGHVNQPLAPGKGTIPWKPFLTALRDTGYQGSLDLETSCAPEAVVDEYTAGLTFIQNTLTEI